MAAAKEVLKQKQAEASQKDKAEKEANQVFEDAKTELRKLNQAQLEKQAAYEEAVKAQKEAETNKDNAQNALNEQQPKCDAANKKLDDAKKAKEAADAAVAEAQKAVQAAKDALAASKSKAQEQWNLGSKGFFQENKSSKALAQLNTDFVVNGKKITSYTTIGNPQDATSLENMKLALETMKEGNDLRVKGDNNFAAMPALKVTDELMAIAQINANYSANYDNRHSGNGGPFVKSAGENLSWGGGSPYTRSGFSWYTSEKAIYDKDPSGNSGVVGHYTNLMNKGFLYTGFASGTKNASYGIVHAQEFWGGTTDTEYTYEEYLARFMKYYNGLKDAKENGSQEARDALAKAEANAGLQEKLAKQAEVEQKLQEAIAASEAEAKKCEACKAKLEAAKEALKKAEEAATSAKQDLEAAKAAAKAQNGVVENKRTELLNAEKAKAAADEAVTQAQEEVNTKRQAADEAQKKVDEKQKALDAAKENYDAVVATKADATKQLDEAENAVKQAEADLKAAESEKAKTDAVVTDADTKLNEAKQKAAEAETQAQNAQKAKDTADQKAADAKTTNEAAAKDYADKAAAQKAADDAKSNVEAADKAVTDANTAKEEVEKAAQDAEAAKDTAQKAKDQAVVDNEAVQKVPDLDAWVKQQTAPKPAPAPMPVAALRAPTTIKVSAESQQAIAEVMAQYQRYLEAAQAVNTPAEQVEKLKAEYEAALAQLEPLENAVKSANSKLIDTKATYEKLYKECTAPLPGQKGKPAASASAQAKQLPRTGAADLSTVLGLSTITAGAGIYLLARRRQAKHC